MAEINTFMRKMNSYFGLAQNDYLYAKSSVDVGRSIGNFNVVATLCTQAAEKFFKAVIEICFAEDEDSLDLLHSHNLRALYNKITTKYSLKVSSRDCKWLGDFYFDARYPGDNFIVVSEDDVEECLELTEQIMNDVIQILTEESELRDKMREQIAELKAFPERSTSGK